MSYSFEGKIVNQEPKCKNFSSAKSICEKCNKVIDFPKRAFTMINNKVFQTYNYLDFEFFI